MLVKRTSLGPIQNLKQIKPKSIIVVPICLYTILVWTQPRKKPDFVISFSLYIRISNPYWTWIYTKWRYNKYSQSRILWIDFKIEERTEGTFTNFDSLDDIIDPLYYYMQYIKFGFGRCIRDCARMIQQGHLSIEKAKEYLNYNLQFNLQKGLKKTLKWYWKNL